MKKLRNSFLIFSIICVLFTGSVFAAEYQISTSKGEQRIVIPEGVSELEAFLEMSRLYLEERFDHEDLLTSVDSLEKTIERYRKENVELLDLYRDANKEKEELSDLYKTKSRVKTILPSFGMAYSFSNQFDFDFGVLLFEKFQVSTVISYPFEMGLRVGIIL